MNYSEMSIFELSEIILQNGTDYAAKRALQRKMKEAVAAQPPFDPVALRAARTLARNMVKIAQKHDLVEDMILDDEVNGGN